MSPPHTQDLPSGSAMSVFKRLHGLQDKDKYPIRFDGLYTDDPKTNPDATFIPEIRAAELIAMKLRTLPIEPVVLDLLTKAKLVKSVRIINGLVPGNLTRALAGEPVGSVIRS